MNNHLEIDNEVALFNVSFFVSHMQQGELGMMKKLYYELVDLMQLSNFLEIFSSAMT
jgi:hypothetical protein